jgi:transmembrane protein DUF3566
MRAVLTTSEETVPRRGDGAFVGPRRARMVVKRVDPLSVLKVSVIFYTCVALVIDVALVIVYWIIGVLGVLQSLKELLTSLGFGDPRAGFEISGAWMFKWLALGSIGSIVVWSVVTTLFALLYNLVSDLVGGVSVTLTDKR